jgi:hypothetical protein
MTTLRILLSGMIAGDPHQGGAAWAVLQYLLGLRRLGHQVYFVEPIKPTALRPAGVTLADSVNAAYFRSVMKKFGLESTSALLLYGSHTTYGLPYDRLRAGIEKADLLLNISGMLQDPALVEGIPVRVYLDLDPAFIQLWHAVQGIDMRFAGHTHFVTVGQGLGQPECSVPVCGLCWIPTLPPVVLEHWPVAENVRHEGLTTVGNWRGYGSIEHDGVFHGQKAHSLRRFIELPRHSSVKFMPALAIHASETPDIEALRTNGWHLLEPAQVAGTPDHYREFIQDSWAELGIAKSGYVVSRCGWFSDRSACYLASGRPVLAQETGFSRFLPVGTGLLAFSTLEEALAGIASLQRDYKQHAREARRIAEDYFDSDKVLGKLLAQIGGGP